MLSENLIHKIGELTDTNMDEGAIRAFQSKLQVGLPPSGICSLTN